MVFIHFKIVSSSLRFILKPVFIEHDNVRLFIFTDGFSSDFADLFIFGDSYKDVLEELDLQMSNGTITGKKESWCSLTIFYVESSVNVDMLNYCLQKMEEEK